jgi:hypothetical protein
MDGQRTFGQPIPDDKLSALMNVLYNVWFKKWKHETTEKSLDTAINELSKIMEQGQEYPVVAHLSMALLYELDARIHGGYTQTTRDKLLKPITMK